MQIRAINFPEHAYTSLLKLLMKKYSSPESYFLVLNLYFHSKNSKYMTWLDRFLLFFQIAYYNIITQQNFLKLKCAIESDIHILLDINNEVPS